MYFTVRKITAVNSFECYVVIRCMVNAVCKILIFLYHDAWLSSRKWGIQSELEMLKQAATCLQGNGLRTYNCDFLTRDFFYYEQSKKWDWDFVPLKTAGFSNKHCQIRALCRDSLRDFKEADGEKWISLTRGSVPEMRLGKRWGEYIEQKCTAWKNDGLIQRSKGKWILFYKGDICKAM